MMLTSKLSTLAVKSVLSYYLLLSLTCTSGIHLGNAQEILTTDFSAGIFYLIGILDISTCGEPSMYS